MTPRIKVLLQNIQKILGNLSGYAYSGPIAIHSKERDDEIRDLWSNGMEMTWELEKILDTDELT